MSHLRSTSEAIMETTEEPQEMDPGSPEFHIRVWMIIGLTLVTLVLVGLGIRKMYYCCKKAYNFGLDER